MRAKDKCKWCGKAFGPRHQYSESFCFIKHERKIRERLRPSVSKVHEAYSKGRLRSEFNGSKVEEILLKRQQKKGLDAVLSLSSNGYKVPRNVSHMLEQGFVWAQVVTEKPWAVYVLVPREGQEDLRRRKRFNNLYDAVVFHRKARKAGYVAGIVSLARAYELPREWYFKKDKLKKKWKWCPYCADFRTFKRVYPERRFEAPIKRWDEKKGVFTWKYHMVYLMACTVCGNNNREPAYRRANQPFEIRYIKAGARRIKPRPGTPKRVRRK